MNESIACPECNHPHTVNPDKHRYRPKYCVKCRTIIVTVHKGPTAEMLKPKYIISELSMAMRNFMRIALQGFTPGRGG